MKTRIEKLVKEDKQKLDLFHVEELDKRLEMKDAWFDVVVNVGCIPK